MNFVFISTMEGTPWGGSEELWCQAAAELIRQGHSVRACVTPTTGCRPALDRLVGMGARVHTSGAGQTVWSRISRRLPRRDGSLLNRRDGAWLSQHRSDLVCVSQGGIADGLPWLLHCRKHGLRYALVAQANVEWLWPDDSAAEPLAMAYRSAHRCFFVSERNRELFEDQIAQELPNAALVRNPYNVPYDAKLEWPETAPDWRFACVARLDPIAKGQDLLLRVLQNEKWKSRNLRISLFGKGRCENGLRQLAARVQARGVEFKGHVDNVEKIWAEHHALVLPSRYEGTSLALVEAMLCGRPAIVTDVGGNAELVEDGKSGFIAPAPSVFLLDQALERAWNRRTEWARIGRAARERIRSLVSADPIEDFSRQLLEIAAR